MQMLNGQDDGITDVNDEYETPEQASYRILNAAGAVVLEVPDPEVETIVEYGAFNDAEYFNPMFESGEIHESLRNLVTDPLHTSNNLRSAVRFADLRNDERALDDKMGKYGPVIVRTRTITQTPWKGVSYDEIDRVRRR